ncbi:mediator complex subunit Med8 [Schizosaccharomyces pombe]|uniref:Mediator of RNA polymerase II transcription subunit 8 n=1 Tax=Schizosaccharomyces pombe (strain 972 / ATCC 24843) TaxID=284812 RepID=MED8_SCHPO|nr:mediator complex subunit Med8 [Schizosaccharomyces pombe]O94646.1 RecName: Full=Mediator of RNA polymerase II transcription subunit 8; AltName: Full=Cell separation protein sep15; AltName: Full=Mediator complex subunit 8 [Schizosaccharomyces pombe 972h-]4H63_H Chain H, Mediator of RNA polymerase II transcription subunit 8 [Schizosaccharomyces pombe 972h-]5N9J_U Chain U, Mediator of RNA polymerase II transcription subunit 8 [Schizosaccharomyces pombe]5U0P_H Chain H, Mediator complex subunit 8|eukprot:NP_596338.1 mediator complex subunit Med8 [Schizosaccharomyces pombe]
MEDISTEKTVESLEAIRHRIAQIVQSLTHFLAILHQSESLSPWPTIHKNFNILLSQIHSLSNNLAAHSHTLQTTSIYPSLEFPVKEQEPLLTTLLRTKALPEVEEWEANTLQEYEASISSQPKKKEANDAYQKDQLWDQARIIFMEERENYSWFDFVTRRQESEGEFVSQRQLEIDRATEEQNANQMLTDILSFMKSGKR